MVVVSPNNERKVPWRVHVSHPSSTDIKKCLGYHVPFTNKFCGSFLELLLSSLWSCSFTYVSLFVNAIAESACCTKAFSCTSPMPLFTMIYRRRRTQNTGSYNICTLSQNAAMMSFTPFHPLVFFAISFPSGFPDCTVSCLFIVSLSLTVSFGGSCIIL